MLLLGHAGITLGAVTIILGTVQSARGNKLPLTDWLRYVTNRIDIRILLIGSLLPDIIDKPLGLYFLKDSLGFGRIYTHTLLLFIVMLSAGLLYRKLSGRMWLLWLATGTFFHLVLDEMWLSPEILFWPLLGSSFPVIDVHGWLGGIWENLMTMPYLQITEGIGLLVMLTFFSYFVKRRTVTKFLKRGRIE